MLADLEGPLLATLQDEELQSIQRLTETASSMIWVTCGGLLSGQKPEYAMASGFARVLRSEKQSLDLVTLDFDSTTSSEEKTKIVLMDVVTRQAVHGRNSETEYCVDHGVVHVGRLVPNKAINENFTDGQGRIKLVSLEEGPALKGILQSGKVFFQKDERTAIALEPDHVQIKIMAIGLNREDSLAISGSHDSTALSHEVSGILTAVGSDVSNLNIGDRVAGFAFDTLATRQRTLAKLVRPIPDSDSFQDMATIPTSFVTAFYGLNELARIEAEEVVLILDGSGPTGLAAMQLCEIAKAKAVVVTSSKDTNAMLRSSGFSSDRIITPGREDVLIQIQRVTAGHGADVVFCSSSADSSLSHDCCRGLAPFGRLVTFGRQDLSMFTSSAISTNVRGFSSFAFDIRDLYEEKPNVLSR